MPALATSAFLDLLHKSGLVDESSLHQAFPHGLPDDPSDAAERLVEKKLLTAFQAKMLLAGKHRGLIFGPYKLLDQIGRGGMGIVYLAEHSKLQRRVAIKVLPSDKTRDRLSLDRFYREARAAASLDHPNIVKAYDVGEQMGIHYFAMEFVQGVNLQTQLTQKGPLPWRAAVRFVAQACRGLQHAHERRLVHRDIKPANLLVDRQGTLKILDFGLARCFLKPTDDLTAIHSSGNDIIGSVDYMAPELAIGGQTIDVRTDLYSLGVTLFALIVGKAPFRGTPAQTLLQHQMKPLPALHEFQPEVPETLTAVMSRLTQKQPEKRYPTPDAVLDALAPWLPATGNTGRIAAADAPAVRDTVRIVGRGTVSGAASRDTKVVHAEDTVTEFTLEDDDGSTTRTRRKRRKKRRSHRSYAWLWAAAPAAVLVPLAIWGSVALIKHLSSPGTQVAAADARTKDAAPVTRGPSQPPGPPPPVAPTPPPAAPPAPGPAQPPAGGENAVVEIGRAAPEIDGEDLAGECFRLSDYRGKVVLLNFWGFW